VEGDFDRPEMLSWAKPGVAGIRGNERWTGEVIMLPNGNEYTYAKQFEGNLRGSSEPVPVRLNTSLRMMSQEMVRELQKLDHRTSGAPQYVFVRRDDLPLHPSLQATGLHYFEW
jgi:hypothetical protein